MTQAIQSTSAVLIVHATTAYIYTAAKDSARKEVLTMTEYIENPLFGKLRGVTYEDGKIIDVHIRDTDDVVNVFVPVRHGRWIEQEKYTVGTMYDCSICGDRILDNGHSWNYCPNCGADMRGSNDEKVRRC